MSSHPPSKVLAAATVWETAQDEEEKRQRGCTAGDGVAELRRSSPQYHFLSLGSLCHSDQTTVEQDRQELKPETRS